MFNFPGRAAREVPTIPTTTPPTATVAAAPVGTGPKRRRVGREGILQAAQDLFAQKGYAATSTRDIADAVGIRQPSLYSHFASKAEILLDILLITVEPPVARAEELAADPSLDPQQRLLALIDFDVQLLASDRRNKGLLYLFPELDEEVFDAFRTRYDRLRGFYRSFILAAAVDDGRPLRGEALVGVALSMIEAVVVRRIYESDLEPDVVVAQTRAAIERLVF